MINLPHPDNGTQTDESTSVRITNSSQVLADPRKSEPASRPWFEHPC